MKKMMYKVSIMMESNSPITHALFESKMDANTFIAMIKPLRFWVGINSYLWDVTVEE